MTDQTCLEYVKWRRECDPLAVVMHFSLDTSIYPTLVLNDGFENRKGHRYRSITGIGGWVKFTNVEYMEVSRRDGGTERKGPFPTIDALFKRAIDEMVKVTRRYAKHREVQLTRAEYKEIRVFFRKRLEAYAKEIGIKWT